MLCCRRGGVLVEIKRVYTGILLLPLRDFLWLNQECTTTNDYYYYYYSIAIDQACFERYSFGHETSSAFHETPESVEQNIPRLLTA
jgi:hypothetical protein